MNDTILWYTTRGAGVVSLVLLTGVVVLGIVSSMRWQTASWPRFLTSGLHRNLALATLIFLAIHIVTAVVDPFTALGWQAALVPFSSSYRRLWLGLGVVAIYLLLAIVITSVLRPLFGHAAWRATHWLTYLMWPVAVIHGIGTGTDRGCLANQRRPAYGVAAVTGRLFAGPEVELISAAAGGESLAAHRRRLGPLPGLASGALIAELEASGLLGRGGAGFPVGRKWRAVAERSSAGAVVLANGAEGEPLSLKDRSLMAARPHLVIDGALLAARAVGADDIIFYVGVEHRVAGAALLQALAERPGDVRGRARIVAAPAGYVSGEESAAVHYVNAGDARPTTTPPRPFERGVGGRPTLVQNVESLALAALIARRGHAWYEGLGQGRARGVGLLTVSGAVNHAGVHEVEFGSTLSDAAAAAGGLSGKVSAVLLGGYFGGWADADEQWGLPLDAASMRARALSLGCGVVHFLPAQSCGVQATAGIMAYLASESARQCGPCVFGLTAIAEATGRLAARSPRPGDVERILRWSAELPGRGACRHPDGAVGLLHSALQVFADDFAEHQRRRCLTVSDRVREAVA